MLSALTTDCCCDVTGARFVAFPCWESRTRQFDLSGTAGAAVAFTASGSNPNSATPPVGTVARIVLIGAGGAGNGVAAGGGGAYLETTVTLPATSNMRIGRGGSKTDVGATVFGGGARGPSSGAAVNTLRYGGGASGFDSTLDYIAGGGGGAASTNFAAQTGLVANGGSAGVSSSIAPSADPSSAGGATNTTGGVGGLTGGGTGTLGTLPAAGNGGSGAVFSVTGGGGGGGGGRAAGGGGGNQTIASVVHGGAGSGGASTNGNPALTHSAIDTYTQASPFTNINATRGIGDGSLSAGGNGRGIVSWRGCSNCPCPEMPALAVPPALHICLTQEQFNTLRSRAEGVGTDCGQGYIGFEYQGFPFYIAAVPQEVVDRPCSRAVLNADLVGGRCVSSSGYCCRIWSAAKYVGTTGNCTPACGGVGCVDTIYFCDRYRAETLGINECDLIAGKCVFVEYNSCDYIVNALSVDADCITPAPSPLNVGTAGGVSDPPCDKAGNAVWEVGPHVFSGGFACGFSMRMQFNAAGVSWAAGTPTAACRATVGNWQATVEMPCLYWLVGKDTCSQAVPCQCGADYNGTCITERTAVEREGLCNATANPNVCSNPCTCAGWYFEVSGVPTGFGPTWWGDSKDAVGGVCPQTYSTALTITRNCAHPTSMVVAVSVDGGEVVIDGCTFQGNGTAAQFAAKINAVLGDRVTATGSNEYWFGPRWRGTKAYPDDFNCNGGALAGDFATVISNTSTVAVIAAAYSSVWRINVIAKVKAEQGFFDDPITPEFDGACGCCQGCCLFYGTYISTACAYEKPHINITVADFGGSLTLLQGTGIMSCASPPEVNSLPATITLL